MVNMKHGKTMDVETHACGCTLETFDSGIRRESLCPNHQAERSNLLLRQELANLRRDVNIMQHSMANGLDKIARGLEGVKAVQWYRPNLWRRLVVFVTGRKNYHF